MGLAAALWCSRRVEPAQCLGAPLRLRARGRAPRAAAGLGGLLALLGCCARRSFGASPEHAPFPDDADTHLSTNHSHWGLASHCRLVTSQPSHTR